MRIVMLDGRAMKNREQVHELLRRALCFPTYYGNNLDALHDLLRGIHRPTRILLFYPTALEECLGAYGNALLRVLRDSVRENPNLRLYTGKV